MVKLLLVYHSQSGNTQALAEAVEEGAKKGGAEVVCKLAAEIEEKDFFWADVFAFGSPDYFSYMAGALKDVFDRLYYQVKDKIKGKSYGVFVTHGGGGRPAVESIRKLASNLGLEEKVEPLLVLGKPNEEGRDKGRDFGRRLVKKS